MYDCLIVGTGAIGLSIAFELSRQDLRVAILDNRQPGRQTSWAAAGIIPPANADRAHDAYGRLVGLSSQLHGEWADMLQERTGVCVEYQKCGGIHLARSPGESVALAHHVDQLRQDGITAELLDWERLVALEPALQSAVQREILRAAYWLPGEAQVRSPRFLQALLAACAAQRVDLFAETSVTGFQRVGERIVAIETSAGLMKAESFCLTAGAWTDHVLQHLGMQLDVQPWRGQIALLQGRIGLLQRIVNEGPNYLVPRSDGRILVGSTMEEVGYDEQTDESIETLQNYAASLIPELARAELLRSWAGLRPHTNDGFPYLGPVPGLDNCFVAAGHHRSGITLAPATGVVMAQLIRRIPPLVDLSAFRLDR